MNRVKQVASRVGGVGTLDLATFGSTPAGYVSFADAVLPTLFRYTIYDYTTHAWEIGYGGYSGGTLTRQFVVATSVDAVTSVKVNFVSENVIVSIDTDFADVSVVDATHYGDGSGGDITISSGTTTLTAPLYAATLTIDGTGQLKPNGWPIYAHILDLRAAPAGAISADGNAGTNSTSATGGAGGTAPTAALWSAGRAGGAGRTGTTGVGAQAFATSGGASTGGAGGAGGRGGNGDPHAGGALRASATFTAQYLGRIKHIWRDGLTVLASGTSGPGGSAGGGNGSAAGGGGGGGGASGGVVAIFARLILLDGAAAGAITAKGGLGGDAKHPSVLGTGGGGGGAGGGGGTVYIVTDAFVGSATDVVTTRGGTGGAGGIGSATSNSGDGGEGGHGGSINYFSAAQGSFGDVGLPGSPGGIGVLNGAGGASGAFGPAAWTLP